MDKLKQLNSFDDIYSITENQTKKEKGDLFELFTYYLFKHDPRLNNNLQNIWLYKDIPKKIIDKLKLPAVDKGIDLLSKINDKYYAIQCKFRQDPNETITWSSLSTFFGLSFGITNKIASGFFVTNTYNLCQEVIDSDKVVPIYGDYYDSIPKAFFKNIDSDVIIYKCKNPLKHQSQCMLMADIHYIGESKNRGYIEMACGSGKTLTSYWISRRLHSDRTVIFVPSLQLLSQFYIDWVNQSFAEKKIINYVLIGSDADVDEVKYKTNGLILSTDPDEIKKCIKDNCVVICTYQSADKLAEACLDRRCNKTIKFDLGIFDEAHKTVGQKNKHFSSMLTNKHLIIVKRLFMTATPKMYIGENNNIVSMNDEKIYGENIYTYNTGQAIADGRLTDYQVLSIYASNKSIEKDITTNKLVKYKNKFVDMEANYLGIILVLLKKFHDGTINHLITYHGTVARSKKFAKSLNKINKIIYDNNLLVASIDGSDSMNTRKNTIREFNKANKSIICSARVLNEGVNIPIVDSVCFVDARESTIDIIQCIGRCLRLYDGKMMAYVIVPIFIENFDDNFDKSKFGNVMTILRALKNTDQGIIEYFKLKANGVVGGRTILAGEVYENISKNIDIGKWLGDIDAKVWEVTDKWNFRYDEVKNFINKNNRLPSRESANIIEHKLAIWCLRQRQTKNILSNDKIQLLTSLSYWYWPRSLNDVWDIMYTDIAKFINKHNRYPSSNSKDSTEKKLGLWCNTQRQGKNTLSAERTELLNKLPHWFWAQSSDDVWNLSYQNVKDFIKKNGRFPIHQTKNKDEKQLGTWCATQRQRKRKGTLEIIRIGLLTKLKGWYWHKSELLDRDCNELIQWIKNNNRLPSSASVDIKEKHLCVIYRKFSIKKKRNELSDEMIALLENTPEWNWNKLTNQWDNMYTEFKKFVHINNKFPSAVSTDIIEKKLATWYATQKSSKIGNRLSNERLKLMNEIPEWKNWIAQNNKSKSVHTKKSGSKTVRKQKSLKK